MTISELEKQNIDVLLKIKEIEEAVMISKEIICFILGKDKIYLIINKDEEVEEDIIKKNNVLIDEILNGKPIQYITNKQSFMLYDFYVNENVLIPQPDTETLVVNSVELAKRLIRAREVENKSSEPFRILDLCTGSGAIAISIYKMLEGSNVEIYASDISNKALEVAKENQKRLGSNVTFIESNMFENIKDIKFDIIVSNPPYIRRDVIDSLSKEVQNEPKLALDGGEDGLKFYRIIFENAKEYINKNGYITIEIGYDQNEEIINLLKDYSYLEYQYTYKDLANNDRCIFIKYLGE